MKKLFFTIPFLGASVSAFAAAETLVGGATSDAATSFSSTYDNSTTLTLTAPASSSESYFNGNSATLKTLTATGDVDYIVNGDFNIDPNGAKSVITMASSTNTNATLKFDNGTVNVGSFTTANTEVEFDLSTYITDKAMTTGVIIGENSTFNVYSSKLTLDGPYGNASSVDPVNAFVVKGTLKVLVPNSEYAGGELYIKWGFKKIDGTTRGSRTAVNVDGGKIMAGNLTIDCYDRLNVSNGGEVTLSGTLYMQGAGTNQAQNVNVFAGSSITAANTVIRTGYDSTNKVAQANLKINVDGTYNGGALSFTVQDPAVTTATNSGVYVSNGGVATFTTADLSNMGNVQVNADSTFNADSTTLGGTAQLIVGGGTANLGVFTFNGGKVNVYSGGIVNISGDSSIGATGDFTLATSTVNVKSGTLSYGRSQLTLGSTTVFNVESGAGLTSNADFNVYSGTFNSAKNSTITVESISLTGSTKVNFDGNVITTKTGTSSFYSLAIAGGSTATFNPNANFQSSKFGRFSVTGDIVANSGEKSIMADQLVFWSKSNTVTINSKNPFYASDGTFSTILNVTQSNAPTLIVRNTATFGTLTLQSESGQELTKISLDLDFANATDYIQFAKVDRYNVARIYVNNFEDYRIKFLDNSSLLTNFELYDFEGNTLDYQWVADAVNGGYWLNTVVPEPAEWAAIFGALALGFAIYRRRK